MTEQEQTACKDELWEDVGEGDFRRTRVPGGWIYEHWRYVYNVNDWEPYCTTFVPDTVEDGDD